MACEAGALRSRAPFTSRFAFPMTALRTDFGSVRGRPGLYRAPRRPVSPRHSDPGTAQRGGPAMERKRSLTLSLFLVALVPVLLLSAGSGGADEDNGRNGGSVSLLTTIPIPGLVVFDISWVDPNTQLYYLADRSNAAIEVIDANRDLFVRQIKPAGTQAFKGFTGDNNTSGPNGVVVSPDGRWLVVTDGNSRVVSIDLATDQIVGDVHTGGAAGLRTDELAYDARDGILLVVNNADDPPFATVITVNTQNGNLTVGPRIMFDAARGVDATN